MELRRRPPAGPGTEQPPANGEAPPPKAAHELYQRRHYGTARKRGLKGFSVAVLDLLEF